MVWYAMHTMHTCKIPKTGMVWYGPAGHNGGNCMAVLWYGIVCIRAKCQMVVWYGIVWYEMVWDCMVRARRA